MNIYEKIAEARVRFQSSAPKMSGENKFAGYKYFELSDILPVINAIGNDLAFLCVVSFDKEDATLEIIDSEKPEFRVLFTSPMSSASLKGCHEVQNLGAVETYIKRYLYQNAFEIVESDALNGTQGKEAPAPQKPQSSPQQKSQAAPQKIKQTNATPENMTRCAKAAIALKLTEDAKTAIRVRFNQDMAKVADELERLVKEMAAPKVVVEEESFGSPEDPERELFAGA